MAGQIQQQTGMLAGTGFGLRHIYVLLQLAPAGPQIVQVGLHFGGDGFDNGVTPGKKGVTNKSKPNDGLDKLPFEIVGTT
jgi:hypothetical protein